MKKLNFKLMTVAALTMLMMNMGMQAQEARRPFQERGKDRMEEPNKRRQALRIPDLSDEQKSQMKAFKISFEKESLPLKNQINELEASLQSLITMDELNKKEVSRVVDDIASTKATLMKKHVDHTAEIKMILNEEQKVFFNKHLLAKKGHSRDQQRRKKR